MMVMGFLELIHSRYNIQYNIEHNNDMWNKSKPIYFHCVISFFPYK